MKRALAALWLLLLASAAALSGCSVVQIAYDNADTYLRWRGTSYLDVHGADVDELDARIQDLLAWHRRQELPRYAALADDAAKRVARGLSRGDVVWSYDALTVRGSVLLVAAAERFSPMLDRLTPPQQTHFEERLADDNRRFARDYLSGSEAERRARRAGRMEDRLKDWTGGLTQAQVERIRQFSERAPLTDEMRERDRKRLQAGMLEIVRAREAARRLPRYAAHWREGRDPAFTAANEAWREELYAMLLDLDRTLTPEQRARAVARFEGYARDMRELASRGAP